MTSSPAFAGSASALEVRRTPPLSQSPLPSPTPGLRATPEYGAPSPPPSTPAHVTTPSHSQTKSPATTNKSSPVIEDKPIAELRKCRSNTSDNFAFFSLGKDKKEKEKKQTKKDKKAKKKDLEDEIGKERRSHIHIF